MKRTPKELADRLWQEIQNVTLLAAPPLLRLPSLPQPPLSPLPDPEMAAQQIREGGSADELLALAEEIRGHRFALLGYEIATGPAIAWRRDYVHGRETGLEYFRRIPYLDAAQAGDHKVVWELNRHQHLVVLAQAYRLSGERAYLDEITAQLESWLAANPFQRGMNWTSALEVAFRSLSWIWVYHLTGAEFEASFRQRFLESLYRHGHHLETNLSFYFSPNTHLLGEAVALHALGRLFPAFPTADRWRAKGRSVVREQMRRQVHEDGSHFEQSTYYHVYALDMFLFHALLEETTAEYRNKIERMADFLSAVMGPARRLPVFGDDDGGRFFHPYGRRDEFGRATLATCGRLEPGCTSQLFPDIGLAVMIRGDRQVVFDAGAFGPWGSGHSHSDTLSFTVRVGEEDVLIDPGTYTYVGDAEARNWFRGSAAHNTLRIDGRDQAIPVDPFRWAQQPAVKLISSSEDTVDAECRYGGVVHRRRLRWMHPDLLFIVDLVWGSAGEHAIEQFWHLGSEACRWRVATGDAAEAIESWASPVFGRRERKPALRVTQKGALPQRLATAILLGPPGEVKISWLDAAAKFEWRRSGEDPLFFELAY